MLQGFLLSLVKFGFFAALIMADIVGTTGRSGSGCGAIIDSCWWFPNNYQLSGTSLKTRTILARLQCEG
ncbi:hypothetical protein FD14_GL000580 [Secundilactobacillus similis DSM 23365 = JCM 2765]|uniref:Uncharacterized protein n=1 Tax=Secundilactobacillus similis DSM 23365 = JCM 2765 TaxID=1423804 RepID=A0A0R2F6E6_9LACO|nr:hypothetical protein FD14_GL000580 [Secundilactobacillus similis DSM 23365 = JCM 2765]